MINEIRSFFVIASQIVSTCLCLLLRWIYFDASDKIFPHHIPFSSQQFPRDNRNNPPVDKSTDDEDTVSPPTEHHQQTDRTDGWDRGEGVEILVILSSHYLSTENNSP